MAKIIEALTSNRFKSFYWRTGMMVVAVIVTSLADNIDMFAPYINGEVVVMLGLVLGEVSKKLNTK